VFVVASGRRSEEEEARGWLFTVARRRVSRYLRRARVERRAVERLAIRVPVIEEDDAGAIERRARELRDTQRGTRCPTERLEGDVDIVAKELPRDGCLGRSPLARGLVNMELRRGDRTLGTLLAVQSGLAMNAIDLLGSEQPNERLLSAMAQLDALGAFALTESTHGWDSVALETSAATGATRKRPPRRSTPTAGFKTGDMAKVDEDGYLFIVDRKKELIIRAGHNG